MIVARFEFRPGCGEHFCLTATQDIVEVEFDELSELIETVKEFEPYLFNCIATINDKVINLRRVSGV